MEVLVVGVAVGVEMLTEWRKEEESRMMMKRE